MLDDFPMAWGRLQAIVNCQFYCQIKQYIIIEALDDISTSKNYEVVAYQDTLLETATFYQIIFLAGTQSIKHYLYYCNLTKRTFLLYHVPYVQF